MDWIANGKFDSASLQRLDVLNSTVYRTDAVEHYPTHHPTSRRAIQQVVLKHNNTECLATTAAGVCPPREGTDRRCKPTPVTRDCQGWLSDVLFRIRCKVDKKLEPLDQFSNNQLKNYHFHKGRGKTIELKCRKHTQGSVAEILCQECGKLGPPEVFSNTGRKNADYAHRCRDCICWAETDMPGTAALPAPRAPRAANEYEFARPDMLDGGLDEDDGEDCLDKNLFHVATDDITSVTSSSLCATETATATVTGTASGTATSAALNRMQFMTIDGGDDDNDDYYDGYDGDDDHVGHDNDDVSVASSGDSTQAVANAGRHVRPSHKKSSVSTANASVPSVQASTGNMQKRTTIKNGRAQYTAYGPTGQVQQRIKTVSSVSAASVRASSIRTTTTVQQVSARGGFAKVKGRRTIPDPPNYLMRDHPDDRAAARRKFSDGESEDEF